MRAWKLPLVRALLAYTGGLLFIWALRSQPEAWLPALLLLALAVRAEVLQAPELRTVAPTCAGFLLGLALMSLAVQGLGRALPLPDPACSYEAVVARCWPAISGGTWLEARDLAPLGKEPVVTRARVLLSGPGQDFPPGELLVLKELEAFPEGEQNPGAPDFDRAQRLRGLEASYRCRLAERCGPSGKLGFLRGLDERRSQAQQALAACQSGPGRKVRACIITSMLFGSQLAQPSPELLAAFRASGIIHVLVVSGSQVALLLAFVLLVLRPLPGRPGRLLSGLLATLAVALYCLLCGAEAPVLRSALAGLVGLAALLTNRRGAPEQGLALAAFLMLVLDPLALFQISFQLSFAAVTGLVLLVPLVKVRAPWTFLKLTALTTVAAQLAVAPILAMTFHKLPLASLGANLLAVPLAACITLGSFALLPIALLSQPAGIWFSLPIGWLVDALVNTALWCAALPSAQLSVPSLPAWIGGAYYMFLLALVESATNKRQKTKSERWSNALVPDPA